ncbi:MAG: hypothetical protein ACK4KT_01370 [Thermaurantimonas sp.]
MKGISLQIFISFMFICSVRGQSKRSSASIYDGIAVVGVLPNGGFLNFTGPNVNIDFGRERIVIGMLPSLRYVRDDNGPTRNALIVPNLGTGITYTKDWAAAQCAFYYDNKNDTQNGRWRIGFGVGVRLNAFNK